ncbi:MAG TPA: ABC transporter permease [Solirubrobacteraceae bacterium]|nr:ABC transporter permease [Solirubrobacteraceae bacterium]
MRWLLLKDLRILQRSPLLVALLVLYPLLVALLVGAALSSGPSKPKVAFANLVAPGDAQISLGGQQLDATAYAARLFENVDPIRVDSREEAIAKVESGEALGALVIPPDVIDRLQNRLSLGGGEAPTVEVYFSAENPLKRRYVESTIAATLADANKALSDEIFKEAAGYLELIVSGGEIDLPLVGAVDILGLRNAQRIIDGALAGMPEDDPSRAPLEQVSRFAQLASENLDVSEPILESIATPVRVDERALGGSRSSLDVFGVEVAVLLSLMVVTLLLAAGMLALEREEHAFGRLVRGLVSRTGLLAEKIVLAAMCGGALAIVMLAVLSAFLDLGWNRVPVWILALLAAACAFAALGVAIGALAREVRAASLLAFMIALPIAALALIPSGAVSGTLYDVIRVVSGAFPFKPALSALDAALSGGAIAVPLLHLIALTLAFATLARMALRRFT